MGVVTDAGLSGPREQKQDTPGSARREYLKQIAARLRNAQSDDDAADALEAALELAKE